MELQPGIQLKSAAGTTEVIVVKPPNVTVTLTCAGLPMLGRDQTPPDDVAGSPGGSTLLGKRYVDEATDIEVLCTKAGEGELAVDGRPLQLKAAKPLPSSD